jgi:hypothetical protein
MLLNAVAPTTALSCVGAPCRWASRSASHKSLNEVRLTVSGEDGGYI